jgi:hypothetical protein
MSCGPSSGLLMKKGFAISISGGREVDNEEPRKTVLLTNAS